MKNLRPFNILREPHISEKVSNLGEESNQYAWWVMLGCNMVATMDGKRDMSESVYIVDLFRNLGWDYSQAMDELNDKPIE